MNPSTTFRCSRYSIQEILASITLKRAVAAPPGHLALIRYTSTWTPPTPEATRAKANELLINFTKKIWTRIERWIESYEDIIGIKQVKEAQVKVLQAETDFVKAQEDRRQAQILMNSMQLRLREVRTDLDRTPRGDDNYLELIKKEIELIREERELRNTFEREERLERELFNSLSSALRFSHEKERTQGEKTKYWSVMASLIGAFLGILGTTINSQLKLRQLRQLMTENIEASAAAVIEKFEEVKLPPSQPIIPNSVVEEIAHLRGLLTNASFILESSSPKNFSEITIEDRFKTSEESRRTELIIATLSILLIVPLLVIRFTSS